MALGVLALVLLGWFLVFVVVRFRSIKAKKIDDDGITLANVAPKFADAVNQRSL
jgi:hypothetical protein